MAKTKQKHTKKHFPKANPAIPKTRRKAVLFTIAVIIITTIAAHLPAINSKTLLFDDDQYFTNNHLVKNPSLTSAKTFLTEVTTPSSVRGYYQPLTMISLMLDVTAGASEHNLVPFRVTSLAIHLANTLLVALLLYLIFRNFWVAAALSLIFGLHPTTIESVAWLSQRKTLLATFFALASIVLYLRHTSLKTDTSSKYKSIFFLTLAIITYILSLLAKPTIVAMPLLLLLLDYWPLKRLTWKSSIEKIPFFIIALTSTVITYISQASAASVTTPQQQGLLNTIYTVCHNIVFYPYHFFAPLRLSWYYPYPDPFTIANPKVLIPFIIVFIMIAALVAAARKTKAPIVGFAFFLLAIFPTIGVIGFHPMIAADRHMYFPMIGLLLPIAAGVIYLKETAAPKLNFTTQITNRLLAICLILIVTAQITLTRRQLARFKDNKTVYQYMIDFAPGIYILHNNYANILKDTGDIISAVKNYQTALKLKPDAAQTHNNLANALKDLGRINDALIHYQKAIELKPDLSSAYYNLAAAYSQLGKTDLAIQNYKKTIQLNPYDASAYSNLAYELARQNKHNAAVELYKKSLAIDPDNIITHGRLGMSLASLKKYKQAEEQFRYVLKNSPQDYEMMCNLGMMLQYQGKNQQAADLYNTALKIVPKYPRVLQLLKSLNQKPDSKTTK